MTATDPTSTPPILTIVLTEPGLAIERDWLEALRRHLPGRIVASSDGPAPDDLPVLPSARGPWWRWLSDVGSEDTENGILLLAAGLQLPAYFGARLRHALDAPGCPPLLTLPGNHESGLDPSAGLLDPESVDIDSLVQAVSELHWSPARHRPARLAIIPPGRLDEAVAEAKHDRCWIYDGAWIRDQDAATDRGPDRPDLRAALGHVREALESLASEDPIDRLPLFGFDERPVVLHISHDWGGGVARWIDDLVAADEAHNHLVLSAGGRTDGEVHGQWLKLYGSGPGHACIRQWPLAPAIAGTEIDHDHYREILGAVIQRYGIGRVLVSSLIGHSLDALATGLPTLEMLHDYYPAWPVLDRDPLDFSDDAGGIDLDRAIAEAGGEFLFSERSGREWQRLTAAWIETVDRQEVELAAPTEQVLGRWRQLVDDRLERAKVIPHGFRGWPAGTPSIEPRDLPDGRLNLVIVGRLSPGKGLGLLDASLDAISEYARITLVGCGRHGMRFFGRAGIDIVLDYNHEDLPGHLSRIGAQAVLFLSTVAETWNYVLSETRALGLVPLATRTGSFAERIRDGIDGILFDPAPEALTATLRSLHEQPQTLEQLRGALPAEPPVTDVMAALDEIVGLQPKCPRPASDSTVADLERSGLAADRADGRRREASLRDRTQALQHDMERRTDWARKQERLANDRTRWAQQLESEVEDHKRHLANTQEHLSRTQQRLETTEADLQSARVDAESQRARAEHLDNELQTIFASRSWRITRPMRVANRITANAVRRRVYNPMRWPRLIARLFHNLRLYGARGALELMQQGAHAPGDMPATIAPVDAPGEKLRPVAFDGSESPAVSIIIPVFNKVHYTSACLNSIVEQAGRTPFEVIVVDDCSEDGTSDFLAECEGLRVVRNRRNSGFIASCNAGAEIASGDHLVFLNNDTTVTASWLEALLETFEAFPQAGIVGARLVYPDGTLQEAGGIVFNDGSGWNYGRGDQPDRPDYNFACEADYVSGACLAIERDVFARLGGFDRHYAPAYYEDTDLCFRVREQGLRVIYQPACTIVHHEGISSGTDEHSGTKRYQAVNREKFLERWRTVLESQPSPVPGPEALNAVYRARHHRAQGHIVIIDATTPEPDKDSGSMRMVATMTILRDLGYRVTFIPENLAWMARYTRGLQSRGIEVLHHPWVNRIEDWLSAHGDRIDHLLVSRHYVLEPLLSILRRRCKGATVIFDTVDLHFLREERMAEIAGDEKAARSARKTRETELSLVHGADATLVVSPFEQDLLKQLTPEARIEVLSNIHRVHGRRRQWADRRDLLFVGGFQHPPNIDAAEWLIEGIMPIVLDRIPELRLHIIGSRMPEALRERRCDGVVMHGYVEDLTPYLEGCRLSVAPLRYGAGVKGKVNQAMSWGLPVVATGCAAEGMYLEDGEDVLLADTTEAFADAIVRAYNDEALWTKLSEGGLANVERHFSFDAARRAISNLLASLENSD